MKLIYTGSFEQLQKFGMFHNPSSEVWLDDKDYQILTIYEDDRTIELKTIESSFGNYELSEKLNSKALSIFYDLIQAGIVKKEEEYESNRCCKKNR